MSSLRQLSYAIALFEDPHFRRTAQRLDISQATLTQQIRDLERRVGVVLFARTSRRVTPTRAAAAFIASAKLALDSSERAVSAARLPDSTAPTLRVGSDEFAMFGLLPSVVSSFCARNTDIMLKLEEKVNSGQLRKQLRLGTLDAAFTVLDGLDHNLESRILEQLPVGVLLSRSHSLSRHRVVSPHAILNEQFIEIDDERLSLLSPGMREVFAGIGKEPSSAQRCADLEGLTALVSSGDFIALVPLPWRRSSANQVVARPLLGTDARISIGIVWAGVSLSRPMRCLLDVIESVVKQAALSAAD